MSESDSVNNVSKDYTPVDRSSIVKVTTQGGIDVRFPANWFRGYANLAYFDGSGMDTSQATNLSNMFAGDVKLADFVTSAYRWNTSNVTNMSGFLSGTALTNLDMLSTSGANGFNVSNVKDLSYAFNGMTSLTDISGLANWQINSSQYAPVNMSYMLYGDTKLLSAVPLQGLDRRLRRPQLRLWRQRRHAQRRPLPLGHAQRHRQRPVREQQGHR